MDSELIKKAFDIAMKYHEKQHDKVGNHYFAHIFTVAEMTEFSHIWRDDKEKEIAICVALLRDILNMTTVTPEYLYEQGFNDEVVDRVIRLTPLPYDTLEEFVKRCSEDFICKQVQMYVLKNNMDITRYNNFKDIHIPTLEKYHNAYMFLYNIDNIIEDKK